MTLCLCEMVGANVPVSRACSDLRCDSSGQNVVNKIGAVQANQPRADSGGLGAKGLNHYSGLLQNLETKKIMTFVDFS